MHPTHDHATMMTGLFENHNQGNNNAEINRKGILEKKRNVHSKENTAVLLLKLLYQ